MASGQPVGIDLGTTGGDWLFKQGDLLLGPVPAKVLVDKLYRGEIDSRTPVARDGQEDFVPIEQIEFFKLHAKKAQVKVQIDRDTTTQRIQLARKQRAKLGGFATAGLVLLLGGAYGAYWLAVNKPWRSADAEDLVAIEVEAPSISLAPSGADEVAIAIPDAHPTAATPPHRPGHTSSSHRAPTPGPGPQNAPDSDGLMAHQQFDSAAIAQIAQSKASSIYPCIKTEAKAHPPQEPVSLPLEFSVGNDGHVAKLWVDNHDFGEGTALYGCISRTLKTWSFPRYQGEQASVKLHFSWGPKH